ncbi:armadillo-type protein [Mycena latifolia]|nr:armadillo-type protein [Mycena latifolia]
MGHSNSAFASDEERARMDLELEELTRYNIPEGSMTASDFYTWIQRADVSVQNLPITDISWWEEVAGLKHQFILLRFRHPEPGHVSYLKLERAGKAIASMHPLAIDKATISSTPTTSDPAFFKQHELFFALVSNDDLLPSHIEGMPAFVDFLDHKWRGPEPTLQDLGVYLKLLVSREPNYSLTAGNCFWFSRTIMHIIGLRHYSFPFIAFSMDSSKFVLPRNSDNTNYGISNIDEDDWKAHDPSSIGLLFRFLHYEEWRNGWLMFRRLIIILVVLISCGIIAGSGYGFYRVFRLNPNPKPVSQSVGYACLLAIAGIGPICGIISPPFIRNSVTLLTYLRIRRATEALMKSLDRDSDPESARGDFIPPKIPLFKQRSGPGRIISGTVVPTYTMRVSTKARKLPSPWERVSAVLSILHVEFDKPDVSQEEQIYSPAKEEYEAALEEMRSSEDDLLTCSPATILAREWWPQLLEHMHTTESLHLKEHFLVLLHRTCETEEGTVAVVRAGAIIYVKRWSGNESRRNSNIRLRLLACRILARMAGHKVVIPQLLELDICEHLVSVLQSSDDKMLHVECLVALTLIVQTPIGAQAAIDADIFLHLDDLLESGNVRMQIWSCHALKWLVWLKPAEDTTCELIVSLMNHPNTKLQAAAFDAVFEIGFLADGVEMLVSAGAFDRVDWMALLQSSDDTVRENAPGVLVQLIRWDHTEAWRRVMGVFPTLVSLMCDDNAQVAFKAQWATYRIAGRPLVMKAFKDAAAMDILGKLVQSPNEEVRLFSGQILETVFATSDTEENEGVEERELLQSTAEHIVHQHRCRELVRMISDTINLELKLQYLQLLCTVCASEEGAELAVAEGSLLLMKGYLTSCRSVEIQIVACNILGCIAGAQVVRVDKVNIISLLVDLIKDPYTDVRLINSARHALDNLVSWDEFETGARELELISLVRSMPVAGASSSLADE